MSDQPVISMTDLSFSYNGEPVLEDVNLRITPQDFVTILGPNGGGKTTLLKLMLGLLHPTSGTVRIFGRPPREVRPRIGYMPQHAALDSRFPARVMDVVLMGRLDTSPTFGPFRRRDKLAAERVLEEMGIGGLSRQQFSQLSGGQQQRALIARALVSEPDLLLLDEPTSNLDVVIEGEIHHLLCQLNTRISVVTVSHDVGFVTQCARTAVCVNRRVWVHPTRELTGELISEVYGGNVRMVHHGHHLAEGGAS